jgi:hypothetical protein
LILAGLFGLNLDTLPPEDARRLLLKIAPHVGEHADEIARLCAYLPLALRLAASALAAGHISPADYLKQLSDAQKRFGLVEASLSLSHDRLNAELQRLWPMLAVFPATFDAPAAAAVWGAETEAALDTLGELVRCSLVEYDEATSRYRLHGLARLFADNMLGETERRSAQARHAEYYLNLLGAADDLYLLGGEALKRGLALFDLEWRNVQEGHAWAERYADGDQAAATLSSSYASKGARILDLRQSPREQILWLRPDG